MSQKHYRHPVSKTAGYEIDKDPKEMTALVLLKKSTTSTIQVGEVETLEPDEAAYVENVGDEVNAVFDFGIPKGEKGDTGETGEKGDKGDKGDTGNTPDITATATATSEGHIGVEVTKTGDIDNPNFNFAFTGLGEGGGGGGTTDYDDLVHKPQINGHILSGNKTAADLDLEEIVELTQAEYDALVAGGTVDPDIAYFIKDGGGAESNTPVIGAAATVDNTSGNPQVQVTKTGTAHNPLFTFAFTGIKGQDGTNGTDGSDGADGSDGVGIVSIAKTATAGDVDTYTITLSDGNTYDFTVTNGHDGTNGTDGTDGTNGTDGVGIVSIAKTGTAGNVDTYTITLSDGNTDTFTVTNGTDGTDGTNGTNGTDGNGIASITLTSTSGLVDTYTITYTDGTTSTFNVTNGADGAAGTNGTNGTDGVGIVSILKTATAGNVDTYTITYTDGNTSTFEVTNGLNGTNGTNGADGRGIVSISKTSTSGLVDTYTITYTDNTTSTFTVTNGSSGGGTSWDYSTSEVDTGQKWINGSEIYCKVVSNTFPSSVNTEKRIAISGVSPSKIVKIEAVAKPANASFTLQVPFVDANGSTLVSSAILYIESAGNIVVKSMDRDFNDCAFHAIIYYTK